MIHELIWISDGMILRGKNQRTLEKNLSQCHFVHHKSHMDCPGCEPRPAW
jgi:hypothetical protein